MTSSWEDSFNEMNEMTNCLVYSVEYKDECIVVNYTTTIRNDNSNDNSVENLLTIENYCC